MTAFARSSQFYFKKVKTKNISSNNKNTNAKKPIPPKAFRKMMTNHVAKSIIYGRFLICAVAVIAQIVFFYFAIYTNVIRHIGNHFFIINTILSVLFALYLVNKGGKNEYKLAWILPAIFAPVFAITFYALFHIDFHSKNLRQTEEKIMSLAIPHLIAAQPRLDNQSDAGSIAKTDTFDIVRYLQRSGGFLPYTQSNVIYFPSGEAAFPEILAEIRKAKKFIFIETFIMNHGQMLETLLEELFRKQNESVEIRIIYDAFGSTSLPPKSYAKYLKSHGLKVNAFMPIFPILSIHQFNRDHRKFFITDNAVGFVGGINISDEYINEYKRLGYWKDTVVKVEGPAVSTMTATFLSNWNLYSKKIEDISPYFLKAAPIPDADGVVVPYADDLYNDQDIAENVFCSLLDNARKTVHITTPYLVVNNRLLHSITYAARRGVEVSIIVPSRPDHFITFCIGRSFIKKVIAKGVRVYSYTPGFIHAKMVVADGKHAVVGSINFDYRSLNNQFENAVYFYNKKMISEIEEDFENTKNESTEITRETYDKIPRIQRIIGWVFKIFAPLV